MTVPDVLIDVLSVIKNSPDDCLTRAVVANLVSHGLIHDPEHGGKIRSPYIMCGWIKLTEAGEAILASIDAKTADPEHADIRRNRLIEELILRELESDPASRDQRWIAIARTHFQEGFMAFNRAIAQPARIDGPLSVEDIVSPYTFNQGGRLR